MWNYCHKLGAPGGWKGCTQAGGDLAACVESTQASTGLHPGGRGPGVLAAKTLENLRCCTHTRGGLAIHLNGK